MRRHELLERRRRPVLVAGDVRQRFDAHGVCACGQLGMIREQHDLDAPRRIDDRRVHGAKVQLQTDLARIHVEASTQCEAQTVLVVGFHRGLEFLRAMLDRPRGKRTEKRRADAPASKVRQHGHDGPAEVWARGVDACSGGSRVGAVDRAEEVRSRDRCLLPRLHVRVGRGTAGPDLVVDLERALLLGCGRAHAHGDCHSRSRLECADIRGRPGLDVVGSPAELQAEVPGRPPKTTGTQRKCERQPRTRRLT